MAVNKALCFFLVSRVLLTWEPVRTNCATISCRNGWDLWYNPLLWKCRPHLQLTAFTSVSATANPTWHAVHWPVLVAVFRLERTHLVRHRYERLYTDYIQQITNWRPVGQIRANNPVHNWIQRLWTDNEKKTVFENKFDYHLTILHSRLFQHKESCGRLLDILLLLSKATQRWQCRLHCDIYYCVCNTSN